MPDCTHLATLFPVRREFLPERNAHPLRTAPGQEGVNLGGSAHTVSSWQHCIRVFFSYLVFFFFFPEKGNAMGRVNVMSILTK